MTKGDLTPKQTRAIAALMSGQNNVEAAAAANVSKRALQRWLIDPVFRSELTRQSSEAVEAVTRHLVSLADEAVKAIHETLTDSDVSWSVRLRAAEAVLTNLLKLRELVDLERRVARLEGQNAQ